LLPQRRLDYSVDHSVVDTILESLSAGELSIPVRPTWPRLRPSTCWTGETPVAPLTLQRIRKLQEQAAIPDDPVAGFQTAGNLRLPIQTFSERNRASAKLVRRCRGINKRLVLGIAQDSRIRERNGILNLARVYSRNHVHIFLQLFAGIVGLDARLHRPRARIQRSGHIRNAPVERFGISVRLNCDLIAYANVGQILLIDIDQHPDGADVGNHETLGSAGLNELSSRHILLNDQAANRRSYRNLKRRRSLHECI